MPVRVTADIHGLKEAQAKMDQMARDLHGSPMVDAMRDATMLVTRDARKNAPVDTGRLRASIVPEVVTRTSTVHGIVGSNVEYAPYMEFGTGKFGKGGKHWPPVAALERWAHLHGTIAFLVARAIGRRGGLEPRYYLKRAFEDNKAKIRDIIARAVGRIVEKR